MTKPALLRWAGSKKQILPLIKKYWKDDFQRYIEPFCGSASLFFDIKPAEADLSDINGDLINALKQVKENYKRVGEKLSFLPTDRDMYYTIRSIDPRTLTAEDQAVRFIYLNSLCFNGLYRVNKAGAFNVPYGTRFRKELFDADALKASAELLKKARVNTRDFELAVDEAEKGDFIYLDPPYATADNKIFTEYTSNAFARKDLKRLNSALKRADQRGVKFVLSYAHVPEIDFFDSEWSVQQVSTRRNIAGFTGSRKKITEVLVSNIELT